MIKFRNKHISLILSILLLYLFFIKSSIDGVLDKLKIHAQPKLLNDIAFSDLKNNNIKLLKTDNSFK